MCTAERHALAKFDEFIFRGSTTPLHDELWDLRDERDPDEYALILGNCRDCNSTLVYQISGERADELIGGRS